ncbi:aldo/keto reductase [Flavobacterium pedocola]
MKLTLGTVQFGIAYGISNVSGVPSDSGLEDILNTAGSLGVELLDTALAYGNSEERLGQFADDRFKVVTKFPAVRSGEELEKALSESLKKLQLESVYGYLAHNADVLLQQPDLWKILQAKKQEGKIAKIGYSLYYPEQLEQLLNLNCIPDLVQLPFSILDRKFEAQLPLLKKLGTEIHVRSVFLQGLYFMNPKQLPEKLQPLASVLTKFQAICADYNLNVGDVALNYAVNNPAIDQVVIGVETAEQLKQNVQMVSNWQSNAAVFAEIEAIEIKDKSLLNPVNW